MCVCVCQGPGSDVRAVPARVRHAGHAEASHPPHAQRPDQEVSLYTSPTRHTTTSHSIAIIPAIF